MVKRFLIALALLVLCSQAFAISAQDAINFATKQNNFLYGGESVEIFPNVRIENKNRDYWVITVLNGNTLTGFIPVYDKTPSLPDSEIARRELIKTAYVLRNEKQLAESSARQGLWLFDASNVKFFSDLSQDLKNERVDLTTIKTSLGGFSSLQGEVDDLTEQLDEMWPLAGEISQLLLETSSFESDFAANPDTNELKGLERKFTDSFELMDGLEAERSKYLADLDSLRQAIALTNLPLETKQGLNSLANVPTSLQQFGSKMTLAVDLEEKLEAIFNGAAANVDSLVLDLSTRERRNNAMQALFGTDAEILEKTGQASLEQLITLLLNEDYFFMWNNQEDLANAKGDWDKAKGFYEAGSFEQAEKNAESSKKYALEVYSAGTKEPEQPFDTDLLFTGVVLLIIAVIIIYALKNRDKISGLVSGEKGEDELNDWNE